MKETLSAILSNKSMKVALGFIAGVLSGILSTFHLTQIGSLWRPPLFFGISFLCALWVGKKGNLGQALKLFFLFPIVYWLMVFLPIPFTARMTLGACLSYSLVYHLCKLESKDWLIGGAFVIFIIGLVTDLNLRYWDQLFQQIDGPVLYAKDEVGTIVKILIFLWQVIVITTIGFQFQRGSKVSTT